MGLDISYYSNIKEVDKYEEYDINIHKDSNNVFQYQLGSIKENTAYNFTEQTESGSFCVGSYSGYNHWRTQLAIMLGYVSAENVWQDFNTNIRYLKIRKIEGTEIEMKPFYELICFSDCEGVIGPEISAKLYQDFLNFDEEAKMNREDDPMGYFYKSYKNWKEAFRVASNNGVVCFH